jgi:uncharacterized protein
MAIDWNSFTPLTALAGGALIGLSAALLILGIGRVAGISGILGGLRRSLPGDSAWRIAFLAGLVMAPLLYGLVAALPPFRIAAGTPTLVVAGLLVGVGTRYGGGCTSGHGVCGIARLSRRSIAATGIFIAAAMATVFLVRQFS